MSTPAVDLLFAFDWRRILGIACIAFQLTGCAGNGTSERESGFIQVTRMIFTTLRFRRPEGPAADRNAGPGGADYRAKPLPNDRYDCEPPAALYQFSGAPARAGADPGMLRLRECLKSIHEGVEVTYRLKRLAMPFLTLEGRDKAPTCLAKLLPEIPVPREVFFETPLDERITCLSSRLDLERDEVLGLKMPFRKYRLLVHFPLTIPIENDQEMLKALIAWSLTPYWEGGGAEEGGLRARLVPDSICNRCLGEGSRIQSVDGPQLLWPE